MFDGQVYALADALHSVGMLPERTRDVEIIAQTDGVLTIRYTVLVVKEDLPKLAEAFALFAKGWR